jgi:hypothetical protein
MAHPSPVVQFEPPLQGRSAGSPQVEVGSVDGLCRQRLVAMVGAVGGAAVAVGEADAVAGGAGKAGYGYTSHLALLISKGLRCRGAEWHAVW